MGVSDHMCAAAYNDQYLCSFQTLEIFQNDESAK